MSFHSGRMNFRLMQVQPPIEADYVERVRANAAPPVTDVTTEAAVGWVGHRHLLDRDLTDDNTAISGYMCMSLVTIEKRVSAELLKAHCAMEEQAEMAARCVASLSRKVRLEIKEETEKSLLKTDGTISLAATRIVYDWDRQLLYTDASSDAQMDSLYAAMKETFGVALTPWSPEIYAVDKADHDSRDADPLCFSPETEVANLVTDSIGMDFLTWLLFRCETGNGTYHNSDDEMFSFLVEGPITLVGGGDGAQEVRLTKGAPTLAKEAKSALLAGKKLKAAKLTIAWGDMVWEVTVKAGDFFFSGLKVPKPESIDRIGVFQERMIYTRTFSEVFYGLYREFLSELISATWKERNKEIVDWVSTRVAVN